MRKKAYFASFDVDYWPRPEEIEHYFLTPEGQEWLFDTGNETGGFNAEGVDGTEQLPQDKGRTDICLALAAHPTMGVLLTWTKSNNRECEAFNSKGDLTRLREYVINSYGTALSVGLLVPFEVAWKAVKEFLETDGQLPKSIEWIDDRDTPPEAFPDPGDPIIEKGLLQD